MRSHTPRTLARYYAPAVLSRLGRLPSKDQLPIASWLGSHPIGTNYALQVLECLEDLSRNEESSPSRILHQALRTLDGDEGHPKELGKKLRDALHKRLHPASVLHQERFRAFVKQLGLPRGVQLHPPKNFEGTTYQLLIQFETPEDLEVKLGILAEIMAGKDWEDLKGF